MHKARAKWMDPQRIDAVDLARIPGYVERRDSRRSRDGPAAQLVQAFAARATGARCGHVLRYHSARIRRAGRSVIRRLATIH